MSVGMSLTLIRFRTAFTFPQPSAMHMRKYVRRGGPDFQPRTCFDSAAVLFDSANPFFL